MKILKIGAVFIIVAFMQACAVGPESRPTGGESNDRNVIEYLPQTGLSDQQRFREVLKYLEDGHPVPARAELIAYLEAHPNRDVALDLLSQIDLPSLDYFPEEYKEVQLASGQSLSTLSRQYLGSLYRFHALAKYNGIVEPRSIKVGQTIRIPLTDTAREAFAADLAGGSDDANEVSPTVAEPLLSAPEPESPVVEVDGRPVVESEPAAPPSEEQLAKLANNLHKQAVNAFRSQNLDLAISLWNRVLEIDPTFESARLQRSQAIQLKRKLSNLSGTGR